MLDLDKIVVIGVSHENLSLLEREDFMRTRPKYIIEKLYKEKEINEICKYTRRQERIQALWGNY